MAILIEILVLSIVLMYCDCSPIKRSIDQQDADCYGTECYYSDLDTLTEIVLPENLTEVVLVNLPLISRYQVSQIANQDRIITLLSSQVLSFNTHTQNQNQMVSLLDNITGSLNTLIAKQDQIEKLLSDTIYYQQHSMISTMTLMDCTDIMDIAPQMKQSKPYKITPHSASRSYTVRCDLETDGGGWTVIQRRFDGSVDFYRDWQDYVAGFGDPNGEYWAGLGLIHLLTKTGTWELRVDLEAFDGTTIYAHYASFRVGDAASNYRLSRGTYDGTAGNGMQVDNKDQFSTRDSDNDGSVSDHCAERNKGAWWYSACSLANLNGKYLGPNQRDEEGLTWYAWKYTYEVLKKSEMKIRRI